MCPWRSWIARRTPTYAARRVSEIRKRLKALAPRAAKTKKRHAVDYCLTTKKQKADPRRLAQVEHTCPWRSWIARRTPTPKVAGSNPVGHTIPLQAKRKLAAVFIVCVKNSGFSSIAGVELKWIRKHQHMPKGYNSHWM